jgi:alpha-N-acetylglucosaminidase
MTPNDARDGAARALTGTAAIEGLLRRVVGERAEEFRVEAIESATGLPAFEVAHDGGQVVLRGSSGAAQASALQWYLRHACKTQVTWDNPRPRLPARLPRTSGRKEAPRRYHYYLQPCTFSYTTAFWDWARWEREIDWMALHGVNLPLALTGQEAVWLRVLKRFGVASDEIREFLGGPAYLPFTFMNCVSNWAGPLPETWVEEHVGLGRLIVERERQFGMQPVLGAFGGQIPPALVSSSAQPRQLHWAEWETLSLDPNSELFGELGTAFVEEQTRLFGSDHFYAIDPFIEATPPAESEKEIALMATAIHGALRRADPAAKWVLQSWPFTWAKDYWTPARIRAFLDAVPDDGLLLLDLWADHESSLERLRGCRPKPWLWCMLTNFGGRPGFYGSLPKVAGAASETASDAAAGVGATMEAALTDPVAYELLSDVYWGLELPDLHAWVDEWAECRCDGDQDGVDKVREAWASLAESAYSRMGSSMSAASFVICRPSVEGYLDVGAGERPPTEIPEALLVAWARLEAAMSPRARGGPVERDLIDVACDVLARLGYRLQREAAGAFVEGRAQQFQTSGSALLELLADMETLLATRPEYHLGSWLEAARSWGHTAKETRLYEANARRLVTLWGGPGSKLHDYSGRHWSGLLSGFYIPRWCRWVQYLQECLERGSPLDPVKFDQELVSWEEAWCLGTGVTEVAVSDAATVSATVRSKYRRLLVS